MDFIFHNIFKNINVFGHFSDTFRLHNLKFIKKQTITSLNNYQSGAWNEI